MKSNWIIYFVVFLLITFVTVTEEINAQTQIQWVKTYGGVPSQDDVPQKIITDKEGNLFVTGGINMSTGSNQRKACLIKYKPNGDSVFTRLFTSTDSLGTAGSDLILDDSLNIYVAGPWALKYNKFGQLIWAKKRPSSSSRVKFNANGELIYSGLQYTSYTFFVVYKCNTNGDTLQKGTYGAPNLYGPEINGLVIDNENNIIITGKISTGIPDYFNMITVKFSPNCEFLWARTYNGSSSGTSYDEALAVLTDSASNVYVTGRSNGPLGGSNFYTIKYDKFGEVVWERRETPSASGAFDMKMDKDHNLIIVGTSNNFYYRVLKLTSDGDFLWTQSTPGYQLAPDPNVVLDSAGNIYMGCQLENSSGNPDFQVVKYSSNGTRLWNAVYPGSGINPHFLTDLVLDKFGNVIVTGYGYIPAWSDDFVTVKFSQTTGILVSSSEMPRDFALKQNYPNPFNPSTMINYQLTINSFVNLNVYDINGRLVKELVNKKQIAGNYSINFDGSGLPSGTYIYRLQAGDFSETKKMVLLK